MLPPARLRIRSVPLLAIIVAWAAGHGLLYALLTPLWQAPDEPTHVEYACLLAQRGPSLAPGDLDPVLQARLIASLAEHSFWTWVREPTPNPLPATLREDPFFRRAGRQVGDEPPLYYLIPALICRLPWELAPIVYVTRLVSVAFYVLTVWAVWWVGRGIWPCEERPALALAGAAAGLPMLAFLGGAVNNDSLVTLLGAVTFGCLVRLAQRPRWQMVAASLLAAGAAVATKKTAAFLMPLAVGACVWWLARRWRRRRGLARTALVLVALVAATLLAWPSSYPIGWAGRSQGAGWGRDPAAAHTGRSGVLLVDASPAEAGRLVQIVSPGRLPLARGQTVRFSAWIRDAEAGAPVRLTVRDDTSISQTSFFADATWLRFAITHTVAETTGDLRVAIAFGREGQGTETGKIAVDDASLEITSGSGGESLLQNGRFERSLSWGGMLWEAAFAPWLAKMRAPTPPPSVPRSLLYLVLLFPGFWGNFGWLQVSMPVPVYAALAGVCGLALSGLLWPARRSDAVDLRGGVTAWLASGLGLAIAQVVIIPMWGRDWQPQARYLYPALAPLLAFLIAGLRRWSTRWRLRHALRWYLAGFLALDLFAIAAVWVPHYYLG